MQYAYLTYRDNDVRIEWPYTVTETFEGEVPPIVESNAQRTSQRVSLRMDFSTEIAFDICEIVMPGKC